MGAYLYFKTKLFQWLEQRNVNAQLYSHADFKKADQALLKAYRGRNPYRMSIQYLRGQKAKDLYTYGETPLTTLAQIAEAFEIVPGDKIIEMGAGRGRAALFFAEYIGCSVKGYEEIPIFVEKFRGSSRVEMINGNMLEAPFSWASVIFLYGTMLKDTEIQSLCDRFPIKTKILTVSYFLSEYSLNYQTIKTISGRFPWGEAKVYWNERIS